MDASEVRGRFAAHFGREPSVAARAPGRVNLIGEHTDYTEGFVLPMALHESTWVAVDARADRRAGAFSATFGESAAWELDALETAALPHWARYVAGVAALLLRRGARLPGFDVYIASDVPVGGGVSSSAALEVSTALALAFLAGEPLESRETIDLCRAAEHEFAGVPCGIMDQSASLLGRRDHALLLDCRTRDVEHVPVAFRDAGFAIVDSGIRHELAAGAYAQRLRECEQAAAYFQRLDPQVRTLRDVPSATVRKHLQQMPPPTGIRALHVATENERTLAAAAALRAGDAAEFGRLMNGSHDSLRDLYEVSLPEVDELVDRLRRMPGVLGARMTGGGFGGVVLVLVRSAALNGLRERLEAFHTPRLPNGELVMPVRPGPGAELL